MATADENTKSGPANHQGSDLDAPTPPGGPLRQDAPDGSVAPGGPGTPAQPGQPKKVDEPEGSTTFAAEPEPEPQVQPSSSPDGPTAVPAPATPTGEPGPDDQVANAQTSQGEPSS